MKVDAWSASVTGVLLCALACAGEGASHPAAPAPSRPEPGPSPDASALPPKAAHADTDTPLALDDGEHWTFDRARQQLVPRAPLPFEGDRLEPPPPHASALDPAIARRTGALADRFVPTADPRAVLDPAVFPALDELAQWMRAGDWRADIQVELRSDPARCMGRSLAERRADAIRDYLIDHGVEASRISAHAKTPTNPPPDSRCPDGLEPFFQRVLVAVEP